MLGLYNNLVITKLKKKPNKFEIIVLDQDKSLKKKVGTGFKINKYCLH